MQLHQIKPKTKTKSKKIVGRGGKRGTYSGKGMKGQKSRAGNSTRPELRDIIKKLPKKRGYRFQSFQVKPNVINLSILDKHFKDNENVTPKILLEKGLIRREKGSIPVVKLLGSGELSKKLLVSECQISKSAAEKIKKAGGDVK